MYLWESLQDEILELEERFGVQIGLKVEILSDSLQQDLAIMNKANIILSTSESGTLFLEK